VQLAHFEHSLAGPLAEPMAIGGVDLATDHQRDEFCHPRIRRGHGRHLAPVAQNGDPVAELEHLVQPMRDVYDRHTLTPQPAHDLEQALDLPPGQRRGGLVHHQDPCVLRQRLGDLDHLLLCDPEAVHRSMCVELGAQHLQQAARLGMHAPAVDAPRELAGELAP